MQRPPLLPSSPGCYLFCGARGRPLYIGRAVDLSRRVASYFAPPPRGRPRLVAAAASVQLFLARNPTEAAILEHNLIHHWRPRYNRAVPTAYEQFWFLRRRGEQFPTFERYRPDGDVLLPTGVAGREMFGPYLSYAAAEAVLAYVTDHFQLRTCSLDGSGRCVRFDLGHCLPVCDTPGLAARHDAQFAAAAAFLAGGHAPHVTRIEAQMHAAASAGRFEQAGRLRDLATLLASSLAPQTVERPGAGDALAVCHGAGLIVAIVARAGRAVELHTGRGQRLPTAVDALIASLASDLDAPAILVAGADRPDGGAAGGGVQHTAALAAGLAELACINHAHYRMVNASGQRPPAEC